MREIHEDIRGAINCTSNLLVMNFCFACVYMYIGSTTSRPGSWSFMNCAA